MLLLDAIAVSYISYILRIYADTRTCFVKVGVALCKLHGFGVLQEQFSCNNSRLVGVARCKSAFWLYR